MRDLATHKSSPFFSVKDEEPVRHALKVREALASNNYGSFFKLYSEAPNMGQYIMDYMTSKMRLAAMRVILKSYRPSIAVDFITKALAFDSSSECRDYLKAGNMVLTADESNVDTKSSSIDVGGIAEYEGSTGTLL